MGYLTLGRTLLQNELWKARKKERTKAELNNLKSQMNPHFLFNTLNMLYSTAMLHDDSLASMVLKLSDSLHYLMHEGDKDVVPISKELDFIQDYIVLQKARLRDKVAIHQEVKLDNKQQLFPPFLLIPFVENAFKYASMLERDAIPLNLSIHLKQGLFSLRVENPFNENYTSFKDVAWRKSGIGIKNVQKRLSLLFPDKHDLQIQHDDGVFLVTLNIDLR